MCIRDRYEDSVLGRITTEQVQTLAASYGAEQEQLKTAIPQKEREVTKLKATVSGADNFIARAKRYKMCIRDRIRIGRCGLPSAARHLPCRLPAVR